MKKSQILIIVLAIISLFAFITINKYYFPPKIVLQKSDLAENLIIKTNMGDITVKLIDSPSLAVAQIVNLSRKGFYNGLLVHRIVPNLLIQTGDPLTRHPEQKEFWGKGGLGSTFPIGKTTNQMTRGTVAMANTGTKSFGSQFIILLNDTPWMKGQGEVVGHVISGMEVVSRMENSKIDVTGLPLENIYIINILAI